MFDGWESGHGCIERTLADLAGYRRILNKKAVKNWGTKEWPGLTLNLKASTTSVCRGVAFAFADDDSKSQDMLNFLTKREVRIPMMPISHSSGSRSVIPIDPDQCGVA